MTRRAVASLGILAIAIALARLTFLHDLPEWDQSTYFLIGDAMLNGRHLYTDIWDMKPPAIFATYSVANLLTNSSFEWSGYLLSVFGAIGTTIGVYFAGTKWNRNAGLLAALCYGIVSMHPVLGGTIPNTESFINLFLAIGFAIWIHRGDCMRCALVAGCAFAIATMFKQVALAPAIAIAIPAFVARGSRRRAIVMLAMIQLAWVALGVYFGLTGQFEIFWKTNFVYPMFYASTGGATVGSTASLIELLPLLFLVPVGLVRSDGKRNALLALLFGCTIAAFAPLRLFPHYFQLVLVPLALAAGIGTSGLVIRKQLAIRAFPVIALLGLIVLQVHWYIVSPRERAALQHPASFFLNVADAGAEIRSLLRSNETMYCWCDEPELYVLAQKRPPAAGLWKMHTLAGPIASMLTDRTLNDLDAHPPDLVVLWAGFPGPEDHPIYRWIASRYDPIPGNQNRLPLALFARRGSDLQKRTQPAHDK